jgi:hypothetical protein
MIPLQAKVTRAMEDQIMPSQCREFIFTPQVISLPPSLKNRRKRAGRQSFGDARFRMSRAIERAAEYKHPRQDQDGMGSFHDSRNTFG